MEIEATGLDPADNHESGILQTLARRRLHRHRMGRRPTQWESG